MRCTALLWLRETVPGGAGFHMSERDFLFYSFPGQEAPRRFTESRLEIPTPKTEFEKADLRRATWNPRK